MLRIALIGAGLMGRVHAHNVNLNPGAKLTLIYDTDGVRAETAAHDFGTAATFDLTSVYDSRRVDGIIIASSTDSHAEHLTRASVRNIPVLCEKPIDLSLARARDAVAHMGPAASKVMMGFNRRFDPDYRRLKTIIDSGGVGSVAHLRLSSRGPHVPPLGYIAVSGGQLRDHAIHMFDLARWLTGEDPVKVYATGSVLAEPQLHEFNDVDTTAVTLRLPSDALVQIDVVRNTGWGYQERVEVLGSAGLVETTGPPKDTVKLTGPGGIVSAAVHPGWLERLEASFVAELDCFVASLKTGEVSPAPGVHDGLAAQAIAEAATLSLRTGRAELVHYTD